MTTRISSPAQSRVTLPLVGAAIFLLLYLAVSPGAGAVSSGELPLPGSEPAAVHAYLAANTTASLLTGVLQGISGLGLALVVSALSRLGPASGLSVLGRIAGWLAVTAILTSAVLSLVLGFVASSAAAGTVTSIREISFYAGGVVHVVALGLLTLSIATSGDRSRPVRVVGWIAGSLAVLSVLSIAIYYASLFLPVGRLACMVALVVTGVSLVRRHQPRRLPHS